MSERRAVELSSVVTDEEISNGFLRGKTIVDLRVKLNRGDGGFEVVDWFPRVGMAGFTNRAVTFCDLNDDHLLDAVFVDSRERDPGVVVSLGVSDGGLPVLEGRYPLPNPGEGSVLAADLDGDGDPDLVVLEHSYQGQGGVHVLKSQLRERETELENKAPGSTCTSC